MQLRELLKNTTIHLMPLISRHKRIKKLLNQIFVNDTWLRLLEIYHQSNFEIIGDLDTYNVIFVTNIPDEEADEEAISFRKQFFRSLQPHTRDENDREVIFDCGMVLDVRHLEGIANPLDVDVHRLTKRDMFGRPRTWYYSHARATLRRASIKIMNDCLVVDI